MKSEADLKDRRYRQEVRGLNQIYRCSKHFTSESPSFVSLCVNESGGSDQSSASCLADQGFRVNEALREEREREELYTSYERLSGQDRTERGWRRRRKKISLFIIASNTFILFIFPQRHSIISIFTPQRGKMFHYVPKGLIIRKMVVLLN